MQLQSQTTVRATTLTTNKVIRNTYMLLSTTLIFSAITATFSTIMQVQQVNIFVFLIGAYGLMFLTSRLQNSPWGLACVFGFTGFLGYTLGPLLNMYLAIPSGGETIAMALGMTGVIFLGLSGYALTTRKDFSFLSGFLFAGVLVLILAMVVGMFTNIPGLHLAISVGFVLFSSAAILYQTSQMIHDPNANYIMMTIGLYTQIYNLFVSLLYILGATRD